MGKILDTVISFLEQDGWPFTQFEGQPVLQLGFRGDNGQWNCYAQAREEQTQFLFYSVCPVNAPEERRLDVAEFLTRANYGLFIGNFELDLDDGEIRYKTSIDVEGDRLSVALVQQLVYANAFTMDRYLPGIMGVIYGDASPAEAIAGIEE
jgi:hypothetical protein